VDQRSYLCLIYTGLLDNFIAELNGRFGAIQSNIAAAVSAMHPASSTLMLKSALQPLANLANLALDDTELELAGRFFSSDKYRDSKEIAMSSVISSMPSCQLYKTLFSYLEPSQFQPLHASLPSVL